MARRSDLGGRSRLTSMRRSLYRQSMNFRHERWQRHGPNDPPDLSAGSKRVLYLLSSRLSMSSDKFMLNDVMWSPQKRHRRVGQVSSSRLSEPALPLHIALAWLIVKVFPLNDEREPVPIYSANFTSDILQVIAREVFEVRESPKWFYALTVPALG